MIQKEINFIGIGAPRSGTTWIANVLRAHPQVCISEPKEIRYFNRYVIQAGKLKGLKNSNFDKDLAWYMRRFSHAGKDQVLCEYSPLYLSDAAAPAAISNCFPDVKLIVCLRNPVTYAYSLYKLLKGNSIIEDISFEQALKQDNVYIDTGMYAQHLENYLSYFDQNRILLLIFEELISAPLAGFGRIFEFLDVDPAEINDFSGFDKNPSAKRRSDKLHKLAFRFSKLLINSRFSELMLIFRHLGVHRLFALINKATANQETMNDSTKRYLEEKFRRDIDKLEAMFNRDFKRWWQ